MTEKQQQVIDRLRRDILLHDGLGSEHVEHHEYKRFEVKESETTPLVFVLSEVGRKGDEGTLAAITARTTRHICIYKGGGVRLLNAKARRGNRNLKNGLRGYWKAVHAVAGY